MCVTAPQTIGTGFPTNLHWTTAINSILTHWYSLVLCYLKNNNSNLIAKARAEFAGCIIAILSASLTSPRKKWERICPVRPLELCPQTQALEEYWSLTKLYKHYSNMACNTHLASLTISDYPYLKHCDI